MCRPAIAPHLIGWSQTKSPSPAKRIGRGLGVRAWHKKYFPVPLPKLCHIPLKPNEINRFQLAQSQNLMAQIVPIAGKNSVLATNPATNSHIGNKQPYRQHSTRIRQQTSQSRQQNTDCNCHIRQKLGIIDVSLLI